MDQTHTKRRLEDLRGLREGNAIAAFSAALFRAFAKRWRQLPPFKGKVRLAKEAKRLMGLDTHHFRETVTLYDPVPYRACLDLHSWHEFLAFFDGGYEPDTVRFLVRCYDKRGAFLDVGANVGLISLPFASIVDPDNTASSPYVFSIEAVRSNYEALIHNIRLNGRDKSIIAIGKGVGERQKHVEIQIEGNLRDGQGTGTANILAERTDHPCERIPLEITTLDQLSETGVIPGPCSLIKVDVDGYDFFVLQGANKLLSSSRPIIFGEFSSHCLAWHGHSHDNVVSYIESLDYNVFFKSKESWKFRPLLKNKVDGDLLLVPKERARELRWCCVEV
jgi:FkbM family methyltransferase